MEMDMIDLAPKMNASRMHRLSTLQGALETLV